MNIEELLEAREYALRNIHKVPRAPKIDYDIILPWWDGLDEKMRVGLLALAVEQELKLEAGSEEWAQKVSELLRGEGFWEEIALTYPDSLWMIAIEIQEKLANNQTHTPHTPFGGLENKKRPPEV